jgi:hypothetical protein
MTMMVIMLMVKKMMIMTAITTKMTTMIVTIWLSTMYWSMTTITLVLMMCVLIVKLQYLENVVAGRPLTIKRKEQEVEEEEGWAVIVVDLCPYLDKW